MNYNLYLGDTIINLLISYLFYLGCFSNPVANTCEVMISEPYVSWETPGKVVYTLSGCLLYDIQDKNDRQLPLAVTIDDRIIHINPTPCREA